MQPTTSSAGVSRSQRIAFGLLVAAALALRLLYAGVEPNARRAGFRDEIYNVGNVRSILATGSLAPVTAFYASLSYLPQAAVLAVTRGLSEATGASSLRVVSESATRVEVVRWNEERQEFSYRRRRLRDLSPLAYLLSRLFSCLYGVAALFVMRDLGTRLFSPAVGLTAAFLLAVLPVHMHMSGIFKPDALVVMLVLLSLRAALTTLDEPSTRNYLLAGGLVGLAMASKLNAGVGAIPLIVVTLFRLGQDKRVVLRLCLAGLVAAGLFWVSNPDLGKVVNALGANLDVYGNRHPAMEARAERVSAAVVLRNALGLQLDARYFGRFLGAIGLAGLVGLLVAALSARLRGRRATQLVVLLSLPAGYAVVTALFTKADASVAGSPLWSVYLPVAAVVCLAAAWLLHRALESARSTRWQWAVGLLLISVLAWGLVRGVHQLHRQNTPSTVSQAARFVAVTFPKVERRLVCAELQGPLVVRRQSMAPALMRAESLSLLDEATLDSCDAELYRGGLLGSLSSPERAESRSRRFAESTIQHFGPRLFRRQGPGIVVVTHPWPEPSPVAVAARPGGSTSSLTASLPGSAGEIVSVRVRLPPDVKPGAATLTVGGESVPLFRRWTRSAGNALSSARIEAGGDRRLELRVPGVEDPDAIGVGALVWRRAPPRPAG
jgi:hypothetical protein